MASQVLLAEIERTICVVRGQEVMLDSDLADFFEIKTKVLNQSVRRHRLRFPGDDFSFQLKDIECKDLKPQMEGQTSWGQHRKYLPQVFTQAGVVTVSHILKTTKAIEISIAIVRAFVSFRHHRYQPNDRQETLSAPSGRLDPIREINQNVRILVQHFCAKNETPADIKPQPIQLVVPEVSELKPPVPSNKKVEAIQKSVARYFGLRVQDLNIATRTRAIVVPRQIAIYTIRKHTNLSLADIANIFGLADHTTVIHACRRIATACEQDEFIRDAVMAIERFCYPS